MKNIKLERIMEYLKCFLSLPYWLQIIWWTILIVSIITFYMTARYIKSCDNSAKVKNASLQIYTEKIILDSNNEFNSLEYQYFTQEGRDKEGRKAMFEIIILTQECHWLIGSSEVILLNENPIDLMQFLRSPGLQSRLNKCEDLFVFGTASQEGESNEENERASGRAKVLVSMIRQVVTNENANLYTVNLGQHKYTGEKADNKTSNQRSIILVGTIHKEQDVNIASSLYSAVGNAANLPFRIANYPIYDVKLVSKINIIN